MESSKAPPEHLLKGGPRLRFRHPEESLPQVREGIQRWWWEFLRLSKDYWLLCQTSQRHRPETQDRQFARVYRAFGNVYATNFDDWWLDRGSWVFREREAFPTVLELPRDPRERGKHKLLEDHLWVDIPLKLSRRTIQRQLGKILDAYDEKRLSNRLALSSSAFKINPVQFRLHTLKMVHELHNLHRELIVKPKALESLGKSAAYQHRADLFRIGKLLRISPSNENLRGDSAEIAKRQNRMRASVSRLLKRSELLIANVEQGVFPSFKNELLGQQKRFNSRQLEAHKELEELWWQLDLTSSLSTVKLEDARRLHYEEGTKTRQQF